MLKEDYKTEIFRRLIILTNKFTYDIKSAFSKKMGIDEDYTPVIAYYR